MKREIRIGYFKIYIYKESGNLYVKDKFNKSRPLLFAAYGSDNELITLRDYMNLKNISLEEAVRILNDCGAVLIGHCFDIYFYDKESVDTFANVTKESLVLDLACTAV